MTTNSSIVKLDNGVVLSENATKQLVELQLDTNFRYGKDKNQGIEYFNKNIDEVIYYLIDQQHDISSIEYLTKVVCMLENLRSIQQIFENFKFIEE